MTAISIGPLVFDGARFAAVVALLLFFLVVEIAARLQKGDAGRWAGIAVLAWILGARTGFVIANWSAFTPHPLDALKLWQGGFLPAAGWAGGIAVLLLALLRRARGAALPLVLGGAVALAGHQAVIAALPPRPSVTLPDLQLIALDGRGVQLGGRGWPVVLNLWATWCPPCRREMPMMTDLAANTPGVEFVFANQGEEAARIMAFLRDEKLPREGMIRDPHGRLMGALGAIGLPSTLVFDAKGRLVAAQTGEISRAALARMIAQATGE
ncbi:redoxin family protein [Paracoccus sp. P2]|uniref:TlpA family protein disulfide reductase n=1 Tax=Paracoccus pantotrophus TaxID=82367 RepID=A0A7H9BPQ1_PARPN|nr:TlpA disulfide reductase family protein [Paracoccus pantotrophus]MDF3854096.1 TlpA disulfide reductase family protein [Paracoccus pantotrophus]QLH13280.1 TlpA family protein disulfide reductase [Paracoccus pantotrophus]RDD96022.1 TlpA family protein disulfide reductase [Paracoccus pantotrophus]RNI16808.1 TlpA family protein disulfide reductase [Paracoccus pantotrophus]WGR67504.1 TlpA family protein disulfide reductase [Paracoccus pantotrophus]